MDLFGYSHARWKVLNQHRRTFSTEQYITIVKIQAFMASKSPVGQTGLDLFGVTNLRGEIRMRRKIPVHPG